LYPKIQKLQQLDFYDEHAGMRRRLLNDRLLLAERSFLQAEGLQGRAWFKHLVSKAVTCSKLKIFNSLH
jgi:N-acetylated-alpha-linked acidic dipeptidase